MRQNYIQIGSARDGRESYLNPARGRRLHAILIETPQYLAFRSAAGRAQFDHLIPIETPADPDAVCRELSVVGGGVRLIMPGFERYTRCAHIVAARLGLIPPFASPTKSEQRAALAARAPHIVQPRSRVLRLAHEPRELSETDVSFPAVFKPVDGGGGLGVIRVESKEELNLAICHGKHLSNYDNAPMQEWILEEYIDGPEYSVQGLCCGGTCYLLSMCSKVIAREGVNGFGNGGFREVAHIAVGPDLIPEHAIRFSQDVLAAIGYRDGPFHIDFRDSRAGLTFIEMGFRLSGAAITDLVREVSGCDWGAAAFSWMAGEAVPPRIAPTGVYAANVLAFSNEQLEMAVRDHGKFDISIERFAAPWESLPSSITSRLSADRSRHSGPAARIHIAGQQWPELYSFAVQVATANS
jgi:hypothetical protein